MQDPYVPKINGLDTVQNVCVRTVVWIQFTLQSVATFAFNLLDDI